MFSELLFFIIILHFIILANVEKVIEIPAIQTTWLFFGGPNHDELFVTTGKDLIPEDQISKYPDAGKVFSITSNEPFLKGANLGYRFKLIW